MIWRELTNFSSGSVCLVLASEHFDEADYYRDYATFAAAKARAGRGGQMPPRVPFFDMSAAFEEVGPQVISRMEAVLASGRYILGPECDAFEQEFADFIGVAGCVGVGNGLDALRLCLTALGIGAGDDVLVPSNTLSPPGSPSRRWAPDRCRWSPTRRPSTFPLPPFGGRHPSHQGGHSCPPLRPPGRHAGIVEYARGPRSACDRRRLPGPWGARPWTACRILRGPGRVELLPGQEPRCVRRRGCRHGKRSGLVERVRLLANYGSPRKYEHM